MLFVTTLFLGYSVTVNAATTQYWGSTVTQPKQAYFYDCNSSGCTTDYTSSNGIGYDSSGNEYGIYWAYDLNTVANSYGGIAVIRHDTQLLANKIYSTTVYMCSESSYITPINLFSGSLSQIQSRSYPVDQLTGWGNADLGSSYPYARIELGNAISNPIINNCRAVSFIYTPEVNSTYIGFQFTTGSTVTGNQYLIGYDHEYLGDSESLSEEQVDTIINNQTTEINTNITNMQESISSDIQNTEDNINSNIDDMEQAIVDSNKETQDVIKDQFNSCRPSYNLINPDNILINKFVSGNNGLLLDSTVTNTTDYIEVISGIYTFSYNYSNLLNSNQRTYVYYDINKNFIIGYNYDPNKKQNILNIPNNAYYVRISYDKNVFDLQLIKGNYTQYEPYGEEICSNKLDEQNETSKGIWETLKSIPNLILDGIKGLFVPSEDELQSLIDEFKSTMETKLGAIYQVTDMLVVDVFKSIFRPTERNSCITFPEIKDPMFDKLLIEQTDYCFDTLRTDFDFLFTISDMIISIVCTLSFGNMLYKKFEGFIGGDTSDY